MMEVWCVEDDEAIRETELYTLRAMGFEARGFSRARDLFKTLEAGLPDALLLDVMLPDGDGKEVLRTLRQNPRTKSLPILMATAKGTEYDRISGLDLGADDYLVKPFSMLEMVSRIKAVLRRSAPKEPVLSCAGITLDAQARKAAVDGMEVALTRIEFDLLELLLENPGLVLSRERLFEAVWKEAAVETRTVDMHITNLRAKLKPHGTCIKTVRGIGYRLEP